MCILFDRCNLKCSFCFESNKTKRIDTEYIKSLPTLFMRAVEKQPLSNIEITFMGGEVFMDTLGDDIFDLYEQVSHDVRKKLSEYNIQLNWLTNGVFKNRDRVTKLINNTNSRISFSYDCVGRYPSSVQHNMMLNNVEHFSKHKLLDAILITPTKPSIEGYINGESDVVLLTKWCNNLDLSYYIPGPGYQNLNPSDDDLFDLFKWIIDNRLYQFKDIREILKPFVNPQYQIFGTCNCDRLVTITEKGSTKVCVNINSTLGLSSFYGDHAPKVNEQTIHLYRKGLGTTKRGCNQCDNALYCVQPCWTSILFNQYEMSECPFARVYNYIKSDPKIVDDFKKYVENM